MAKIVKKYIFESPSAAKLFCDAVTRKTDFSAAPIIQDPCQVIVRGSSTNTHKATEKIEELAEIYSATIME